MPLPEGSQAQGADAGDGEFTFSFIEDIEPIFQQRCSLCHPGGAPGNWDDYGDASGRAHLIADRVSSGSMPPGNLTDMTDEEREMVLTWVEEGAPLGDTGGGAPTMAEPEEPPEENGAEGDSNLDEAVAVMDGENEQEAPQEQEPEGAGEALAEAEEAPEAEEEGSGFLTFSEDIQPIFQNRCSMCHNGPALGDWTDYEQAFDMRDVIALRVDLDHPDMGAKMPPGNATGMTEEERAQVIEWVRTGAEE